MPEAFRVGGRSQYLPAVFDPCVPLVGGPFRRLVPLDVFDQYQGAASNAPIVVGVFELDIGDHDDFTVTFALPRMTQAGGPPIR